MIIIIFQTHVYNVHIHVCKQPSTLQLSMTFHVHCIVTNGPGGGKEGKHLTISNNINFLMCRCSIVSVPGWVYTTQFQYALQTAYSILLSLSLLIHTCSSFGLQYPNGLTAYMTKRVVVTNENPRTQLGMAIDEKPTENTYCNDGKNRFVINVHRTNCIIVLKTILKLFDAKTPLFFI